MLVKVTLCLLIVRPLKSLSNFNSSKTQTQERVKPAGAVRP